MPRISRPELRPDWIGKGSSGRVAGIGWWGVAGRIDCQRAGGAFGDAETWVIYGGICVSAMRQRCCPWGEVRFGSTKSGGCLFGVSWSVRGVVRLVGGVWRCRGQRGWLAGWIGLAMDQSRHSGRSAAQTRNPCPVERDWIPAVAGMMIWSGMFCPQSEKPGTRTGLLIFR